MFMWWVYVIQSGRLSYAAAGRPGPYYVGSTTDPARRLRQHNGEIKGGGKYTGSLRPWEPRALYGPYADRSEAMKAEMALKRGKKGTGRTKWSSSDSKWFRGIGPQHPWVSDPLMGAQEIERSHRALEQKMVDNTAT